MALDTLPTNDKADKTSLTKFVFDRLSSKDKIKCIDVLSANKLLGKPTTKDQAFKSWWQNKSETGQYLLTKFGERAFRLARIKSYDVDVDIKITPSVLKKLQIAFDSPFYIESFVTNTNIYLNGKLPYNATIYLFSEKDYFTLTLYGSDLTKLLEHYTN